MRHFITAFPFYLDDDDDDDDEDTDGDGLVDDVDPDDDNDGIMDDGKLAVYTECPNKFWMTSFFSENQSEFTILKKKIVKNSSN